MNNNPVNSTDPTGHDVDCASTDVACKQQLKKEEIIKWINQFNPGVNKPLQTNTNEPVTFENIFNLPAGTSIFDQCKNVPNHCSTSTQIIQEDNLTGIMWGVNASGGAGIMVTGGLEELVIIDSGDRGVYVYGGQSNASGIGANATAYIGIVYNIENLEEYNGMTEGINVTLSFGHGFAFGYFVSSTNPEIHGFYIGYAPGAKLSAGWQIVTYSLVESHKK